MRKFKVGDRVETRYNFLCPDCIAIEGEVTEVVDASGKTLYKVKWDPNWTYDDTELQLWEEPTGN